jgi:hypothetical protein
MTLDPTSVASLKELLDAKKEELVQQMQQEVAQKWIPELSDDKPADYLPPVDKSAAQARKDRQARMDALEDKRREREEGGESSKPVVRKVAGKAYGGSAQKDDVDTEVAEPQKRGRGRPRKNESEEYVNEDLRQLVKSYPQAEDAALDFLDLTAKNPNKDPKILLQQAAKDKKANVATVKKILAGMGFSEFEEE